LEAVNADYERHCRAAREIARSCFDAEHIMTRILNETLGSTPQRMNDPPVPPGQSQVLDV
jgi:hypothetical protein